MASHDQLYNILKAKPQKAKETIQINKIRIVGNEWISDALVKNAFGDLSSPFTLQELDSKLKDGLVNLKKYNKFEACTVHLDVDDITDEVVLSATLKEKPGKGSYGGSLQFSQKKSVLSTSFNQLNRLGLGETISLGFNLDKKINLGVDASLYVPIPRVFDVNLAANLRSKTDIGQLLTEEKSLVSLLFTKKHHQCNYTLAVRNLKQQLDNSPRNDVSLSSDIISQLDKPSIKSAVSHAFVMDHKFPTSGFYVKLANEFSGLGGDANFTKHDGIFQIYYPMLKKFRIQCDIQTSYIHAMKPLYYNDKIFYESFRGTSYDGIGPRDGVTKQVLGGNFFVNTLVRLFHPLKYYSPFFEALGANLFAFFQATYLDNLDWQKFKSIELKQAYKNLVSSFGVGLCFMIGLFQIEFNYCLPIQVNQTKEFNRFELRFHVDPQ